MLKKPVCLKLIRTSPVALLAIFLIASTASAAEGGHHQPHFLELVPFWINFLIYVFLLYLLLRNQWTGFWQQRRRNLIEAVQAGRAELLGAKEMLEKSQLQLENIEKDIVSLKKEIESDAANQSKALAVAAREQAKKIIARARQSIEGEQRALESTLQREIAEQAVALARQKLQQKASLQNDQELRSAALVNVNRIIQ
ncbi:MAG: ATP synthase F0 subunit B [Bdellovibrionales bacterium]|nr:ATP synthase F0 subunit B [Bdellovibrionales bacterium]